MKHSKRSLCHRERLGHNCEIQSNSIGEIGGLHCHILQRLHFAGYPCPDLSRFPLCLRYSGITCPWHRLCVSNREPGAAGARKQLNGKGNNMLGWTLMFLVIAIIAGVLGFTSVAGAAAGIAQILFFVFLVLFIASILGQLMRSR